MVNDPLTAFLPQMKGRKAHLTSRLRAPARTERSVFLFPILVPSVGVYPPANTRTIGVAELSAFPIFLNQQCNNEADDNDRRQTQYLTLVHRDFI
jgi:hypothetical protein